MVPGLGLPGERSILARPLDRLSPSLGVPLLVDVEDWALDVVAVFVEVAAHPSNSWNQGMTPSYPVGQSSSDSKS